MTYNLLARAPSRLKGSALAAFLALSLPAALGAASPTLDAAIASVSLSVAASLGDGNRVAVVPGKTDSRLLADYLTDAATQALLASGRLVMLERKDIDAVRDELRFQLSGDVSDDSAQSIGKMLGAEVIVTVYVDASNNLRMKAVRVETARILAAAVAPIADPAELLAITLVDGKAVTVRSVAELLSAIGPDRIIRVAPGDYDLSEGYRVKNRYVSWVDEYDGPCPVIRNVTNLTLEGDGLATLMIRPAYGWVLSFDTCSGISVGGLTLGHTVPGYCLGGVIRFKNCEGVSVRSCDLYGSGTYGVGLERTSDFVMEGSRVHDCTYGLVTIARSEGVAFRDVAFEDTGEFDLVEIASSDAVLFERCAFRGNWGSSLFSADSESRDLTLRDCAFEDNAAEEFASRRGALTLEGGSFSGNAFPAPR